MNRYMKGIGHLIKERVFMKKRLLSFIMSSLFTASLISSLSVYAEESQFQKYTYNELSEMTDDEFLELVKHQKGKDYACYMFGNDDVSDEIKLENYLKSSDITKFDLSDANIIPDTFANDIFEEPRYYAYKQFINGKASPYLVFYVDRYKEMSADITADAFGYSKDWKLTVYDGLYEPFPEYKRQLHEYRVDVPMDVITDFEKYIRLEYSYDSVRGDYYSDNPYGINYFDTIEDQFALYGNTRSNIYDADEYVSSTEIPVDSAALQGTKDMTLDDVKELAKKGDDLTWSDFEDYKGRDIGSGQNIWRFKFGDGYALEVCGVADRRKPDYVILSRDGDYEVDLLRDSINGFLIMTSDYTMTVTVLETGRSLLVMGARGRGDVLTLPVNMLDSNITPAVGMKLEVTYRGGICQTFPGEFSNIQKVSVLSEAAEIVKGDANLDGQVDMADAVLIMQALANPNKYGRNGSHPRYLTGLGILNADVDGDGLTVGDAQAIQMKLLGLDETISSLESIRKKISDFFTENNMCFSVVPASQMPESLLDRYIFLSTKGYNTDDVLRFTGFVQKNDIDDSVIKSIPYYLDDDSEVNEISKKLFYYILENNIPATMYYVDEAKNEKEKTVFVKYSESDKETRQKIEAFLEENHFDPELIDYYEYE